MSLKGIRAAIDSEAGFNSTLNADDKTYLNERINKIAADLYAKEDLTGSLYELITFWDQDSKLVSMPSYVGEVRGARYYDSPLEITLREIRPRYAIGSFGIELKDFREVGVSSLAVQMDNYSTLTFSLPEGEVASEDLSISVIGQTPTASRIEEIVTIAEGENSVETSSNWLGAPTSIRKSAANQFDILVTDAEGEELALIPNNALTSEYLIWQVRDDNMNGQVSSNSIEILFKMKFEPLVNDGDEFLRSKYDDVILWKFLEEFWAKQEGKEEQVKNAQLQWASKMGAVNISKDKGKKAEIQTPQNKFYGLFSRTNWGQTRYN